MGYFDGLTDSSFKTDDQGKPLFYPWGVLGSGYILPSEERKQSLRTFIKRMYMVILPAIILLQIFVGAWANAILIPIYGVWYYVMIKKMTKDLVKTDVKLKTSEAYKNSAKSHNLPTLIALEIVSLIFVVLGIFMIADGVEPIIGYSSVILFGACAVAIGYMINAKIKSKTPTA